MFCRATRHLAGRNAVAQLLHDVRVMFSDLSIWG
jgi:hypothetical protein